MEYPKHTLSFTPSPSKIPLRPFSPFLIRTEEGRQGGVANESVAAPRLRGLNQVATTKNLNNGKIITVAFSDPAPWPRPDGSFP